MNHSAVNYNEIHFVFAVCLYLIISANGAVYKIQVTSPPCQPISQSTRDAAEEIIDRRPYYLAKLDKDLKKEIKHNAEKRNEARSRQYTFLLQVFDTPNKLECSRTKALELISQKRRKVWGPISRKISPILNDKFAYFREMAGTSELNQQVDTGVEDCTTCFEPLYTEGEAVTTMKSCEHIYHTLCLEKWLDTQKEKKCPTCGADASIRTSTVYHKEQREDS